MYILPEKFNNKGFTLIEALMALVVLTIALGPSLILTTNINNTAAVVKNNLVAANLTQEGIEVIRGIRDTNWFNGTAFDTGLANGTYRIEWNSDTLIALGTNPPIKEANGLYNYSTGNNTIFRRTISILKVNAGELRIISEVTWEQRGGIAKSAIAESHLFNWK
ncbi:MAG: type II secretion system protein [Candidatus Yanofskybacteria bacterium]|nr:type II secretion system protein [Candidatus Yanofskybacteria bacterium]